MLVTTFMVTEILISKRFHFEEWAKLRNITSELHEMDNETLDSNLRLFYAEVKAQDGKDYSRSTLLGIRSGLERHLNSPPHNKGITIAGNPTFKRSNIVLNAKIKSLKRQGKQSVKHKPALEPEDLVKLKTSDVLDCSNPLGLQRNVWFNTSLFWCRRGREGQRDLTKQSFVFAQDPTGEEYVTMAHCESSKNHPGGINDTESFKHMGRMYKTQQENDGYSALKLYISKLNPSCEALFQYPKRQWSSVDTVWYENRPLGVNKLGDMMKIISSAAGLSTIYTNHCVRATSITLWSDAGLTNRHIMSISGHRNEQSLHHYNQRPSTSQLKRCSDVLSQALGDESFDEHQVQRRRVLQLASETNAPATTTITSQTSSSNVQIQNLPEFGSLFSSCSIGNVNVNFHLQQ